MRRAAAGTSPQRHLTISVIVTALLAGLLVALPATPAGADTVDAPTSLVGAAAQSPKQLTVTWVPPTSAPSGYELQAAPTGTDFDETTDIAGSQTTTTLTDLEPGTSYDLRIRAATGETTSDWVTATAATAGDSTPTGLEVNSGSGDSATATWDLAFPTTDLLRAQIADNDAFEDADNETFNGTTIIHELSALETGTHHYRIRGESDWATITFDVPTTGQQNAGPVTGPGPPGLAAVSNDDGTATITWTAPATHPESYQLDIASETSFADPTIHHPASYATSFNLDSLTPGATYSARLRTQTRWATTSFEIAGDTSTTTTLPEDADPPTSPAPVPPDTVTSSTGTSPTSSVDVTWVPAESANAIGYRVEISQHSDHHDPTSVVAGPAATGSTFTALEPGTTYHARVAALGQGGDKAWANSAAVTTAPSPPRNPVVTVGIDPATDADVTWTAGAGNVDSYEIQHDTSVTFADPTTTTSTNETKTLQELGQATTYYVRVRATANGAESAWADATPVTTNQEPYHRAVTDSGPAAWWRFGSLMDDAGDHELTSTAGSRYAAAVQSDTPSGYWRMDSTVTTSQWNPYMGLLLTATGGAGAGTRIGLLAGDTNPAGNFDGVDDRFSAGNWIPSRTALTAEAWVRSDVAPAATVNGAAIVGKYNGEYSLALLSNGSIRFTTHKTATVDNLDVTYGWLADTSYHIVGTWDGVTKRLYVNGTLIGSKAFTGPLRTTSADFSIGRYQSSASTSWDFDGVIDEVAIYDKVLSAARVAAHYDAGTASDGAVPAPVGSLLPSDPGGAATKFPGGAGRVSAGNWWPSTVAFTFETWWSPSTPVASGTQIIAHKTDGTRSEFRLNADWNNHITFRTDTPDGVGDFLTLPHTWTTGATYHIAVTWDGVDKKIYINGAILGSKAWAGPLTTTTGHLSLGATYPTANGASSNATYDEAAVYTRALSDTEIARHFLLGSSPAAPAEITAAPGTDGSTLALNWKDQGPLVTSYELQWSTSPTFAGATTKTIASPNTTLTGLTRSTRYHIRVRAIGVATSPWAVTSAATLWQFPIWANASPTSPDTTAVVNWSGGEGPFEIDYGTDPTFDVAEHVTSTASALLSKVVIDDLETNTIYHVRVRSTNEEHPSAWSTTTFATSDPEHLPPDLTIRHDAGSANVATFEAGSALEFDSVRIELLAEHDSGFTALTATELDPTTYLATVDTLVAGTIYTVRTQRVTNGVGSAWKEATFVAGRPERLDEVRLVADPTVAGTALNVVLNGPANADSTYQVQYSATGPVDDTSASVWGAPNCISSGCGTTVDLPTVTELGDPPALTVRARTVTAGVVGPWSTSDTYQLGLLPPSPNLEAGLHSVTATTGPLGAAERIRADIAEPGDVHLLGTLQRLAGGAGVNQLSADGFPEGTGLAVYLQLSTPAGSGPWTRDEISTTTTEPAATAYEDAVLSTAPTALWSFDEATAANGFASTTPTGAGPSLQGGPWPVPGVLGVDRDKGGSVRLPWSQVSAPIDTDGITTITLECWIYASLAGTTPGKVPETTFCAGVPGSGGSLSLGIDGSRVRVQVAGSGMNSATEPVRPGWNHLSVRFSKGGSNWCPYSPTVNGSTVSLLGWSTCFAFSLPATSSVVVGPTAEHGRIDEVAIYTRSVPAATLAAHMNSARPYLSGVQGGPRWVKTREGVDPLTGLVWLTPPTNTKRVAVNGKAVSSLRDPAGDGPVSVSATELVDGVESLDVPVNGMNRMAAMPIALSTTPNAMGNGATRWSRLSYDGTKSVFISTATNLTAGTYANGHDDLFYKDLTTGETRRLLGHNGAEPNGPITGLEISGDARYAFFTSTASNLVELDRNGAGNDIFRVDLITGDMIAITQNVATDNKALTEPDIIRNPAPAGQTFGSSGVWSGRLLQVSMTGEFVAFTSNVDGYVRNLNHTGYDVFVWNALEKPSTPSTGSVDNVYGTIALVSTQENGAPLTNSVYVSDNTLAMSPSGRYILWKRSDNYETVVIDRDPDGDRNFVLPNPLSTGNWRYKGGLTTYGTGVALAELDPVPGQVTRMDDLAVFATLASGGSPWMVQPFATGAPATRVSNAPGAGHLRVSADGKRVSNSTNRGGWSSPEGSVDTLMTATYDLDADRNGIVGDTAVVETLHTGGYSPGAGWPNTQSFATAVSGDGRWATINSWYPEVPGYNNKANGGVEDAWIIDLTPGAGPIPENTTSVGIEKYAGYDADPVNVSSGNFVQPDEDLAFGAASLRWDRTYNSANPRSGALGVGVSTIADIRLELVNATSLYLWHADGRRTLFTNQSGTWRGPPDDNTEITQTRNGWAATFESNVEWQFNDSGELTSIVDVSGQRITRRDTTRSNGERVTTISDSAGRHTIRLQWTDDRVASVTDGIRTVRYSYDPLGQLATVTSPNGRRVAYTWGSGRVTRIDRLETSGIAHLVLTNIYRSDGRVEAQTLAGGESQTFTYQGRPDGGTTTVVTSSASGDSTTYQSDRFGRLQSSTDATGATTTRTYNAAHPTALTSRSGSITTVSFDAEGRLSGRTTNGNNVAVVRDEHGRPTSSTTTAGGTQLEQIGFSYTGTNPNPTGVTVAGATSTVTYDTAGRPVESVDPDGVATAYTYDEHGNIASTTVDPDGVELRTTLVHDSAGRTISATDPTGATTTWSYDLDDNVISETRPDGATTSYAYDYANRLIRTVDAGGTTTVTYDAAGNITSVTGPDGTSTYTWTATGDLLTATAPGGATTTWTYGPLGRTTSRTGPNGATTTYTYDVDGRVTSATGIGNPTDPADDLVATWTYDTAGRVVTESPYRLGSDRAEVTTYTRDALGRVTALTDPTGVQTTASYDASGRVNATATGPELTTYTWTPAGRLHTATDAAGRTVTYGYDAAGRRSTVTHDGKVSSYAYDEEARTVSATSPTGRSSSTTVDTVGRTTRTVADGVTSTYTWSNRDELLTRTVGADTADESTVTFTYGAVPGQLATVTDANGNTTTYTYDTAGNRTARRSAAGTTQRWAYDTAGRLTSETDATGNTWTYTYDAHGRPSGTTDPTGRTTNTTYGPDGRAHAVHSTHADAVSVETEFTYDPAGRLAAMVDDHGTTTWSYDTATSTPTGRPTGRTSPEGTLSWSWNPDGTLASETGPGAATRSFTYGDDRLIAAITDSAFGTTTYTRDGDGQVTYESLPGGDTRTRSYTDGRLTQLEQTLSGNTTTAALTYDQVGRVSTITDGTSATNLDYDTAGQLVSSTGPEGDWSWTYDNLGRRATETRDATTREFTYDSNGALLTDGDTTHRYDTAGRLVESVSGTAVTAVGYDAAGRPVVESSTDGSAVAQVERTWAGDGTLAAVTATDGVTSTNEALLWSDPSVTGGLPELIATSGGTSTERFVRGAAVNGPGGSAPELLGAVTTTAAGSSADTFALDWAGSVTGATGHGSYLPTGGSDDPSDLADPVQVGYRGEAEIARAGGGPSLVHLRARDFDPATTVFTATDPLDGVDGTTTVAGAGYAYAGNDPVNLSDPSGLRPHDFSFLSDPTAASATSICESDDNATIAVFEKATGENCNAILDANKAGWVERNRHHLVNVTVFVAVAVACVATVGAGCVTAAAVGFAAGGALHGSADLIANDTSRNLSPGQAYRQAGESALNGAGAGAVLRPAATALKSSVQAKPVATAAPPGTVATRPAPRVTEPMIRDAMVDAPLQTQQGAVSLPKVQSAVDQLATGSPAPPIKVDGSIIVDGNHRYIAGRIMGQPSAVQPWAGGRPSRVIPWWKQVIDPTDWAG